MLNAIKWFCSEENGSIVTNILDIPTKLIPLYSISSLPSKWATSSLADPYCWQCTSAEKWIIYPNKLTLPIMVFERRNLTHLMAQMMVNVMVSLLCRCLTYLQQWYDSSGGLYTWHFDMSCNLQTCIYFMSERFHCEGFNCSTDYMYQLNDYSFKPS